jgi:hypothetical protein
MDHQIIVQPAASSLRVLLDTTPYPQGFPGLMTTYSIVVFFVKTKNEMIEANLL